jgi:Tfp pilus assembly protein PilV
MLKTNQKGQSLIEMLVALFILVAALTATIVLIVTSINAGRESINKLIGTSLAREGIEVVRNIRDSNWIDPSGSGWDEGLDGANSTAIPKIDGVNPISLNFAENDFTRIKLYNNQYLQDTTAGTDTQFYRLLYINPICQNDDNPPIEEIVSKESGDDCTSFGNSTDYSKVGIRIISEVRWPSSDSSHKVIIEDRLYNWQML